MKHKKVLMDMRVQTLLLKKESREDEREENERRGWDKVTRSVMVNFASEATAYNVYNNIRD